MHEIAALLHGVGISTPSATRPAMVIAMRTMLREAGVDDDNIRTAEF